MFRADESQAGKNGTLHMEMRTETAAVSEAMGITGPKSEHFVCGDGKQWPPKGLCEWQKGERNISKRERKRGRPCQAVSCWPLTMKARVLSWVSACGICGGQSGTGTGFAPSTSAFPCQFHSIGAPLLGKKEKKKKREREREKKTLLKKRGIKGKGAKESSRMARGVTCERML
jgi:hypothetical protein